jgi:hypothetical protein
MLQQLSETTIRDTIAAVFSDPAYRRSTLLQRFGNWLLDWLSSIFANVRPGGLPPAVFWTIFALCSAALAALIARLVYVRLRSREVLAQFGAQAGLGRGQFDAWAAALRYAGLGDYTAAAHALYLSVLRAIAGRGEVELHESKTIGDYLRDLAARSSAWLSPFRAFARNYETVIYGTGFCDRDRYERLLGLARGIVEARG